jgi:3-phytase
MRKVAVLLIALSGLLIVVPTAEPAPAGTVHIPSVLETVPTGLNGDTADDPAIWVNTANPGASLVITNEKTAKRLSVFNLSGALVQRVTTPSGFYGNVDVRGRIVAGAITGIMLWRVTGTADGPRLVPAREATGNAQTGGEGICMWDPGASGVAGGLYVINVYRPTFRVRVHPITDADDDGLYLVEPPTRQFFLGSEGEGCVVDDQSGALYLSEEDVGIWRYDLTAGTGMVPPRERFASVGPQLSPDIEGLTLADGIVYASAQNVAAPRFNWYSRYDAATGSYLGSFRIVDGTVSDDCDQTDGIAAYSGYLGEDFPAGLFVCQDGFNEAPGTTGSQNFKYTPLDAISP